MSQEAGFFLYGGLQTLPNLTMLGFEDLGCKFLCRKAG